MFSSEGWWKGSAAVICFLVLTTVFATPSLGHDLKYDANGNLIEDNEYEYIYNDANRLDEVNYLNGSLVARYFYDHSGRRIKKELADGTVTYYPFGSYEETHNPNGSIERISYYFANGERVAKKVDSITEYYHPDHLGSTNVVSDENGNLVEKSKYYPFGDVINGGDEKYGYTGQEKDSETDLMYYKARYYSPGLRRFTQPDTLLPDVYDPQQLNRYAYVRNNPVKYTDPSGHFICGGWCIGGYALLEICKTLGTYTLLTGGAAGILSFGGPDKTMERLKEIAEANKDASVHKDVTKYAQYNGVASDFMNNVVSLSRFDKVPAEHMNKAQNLYENPTKYWSPGGLGSGKDNSEDHADRTDKNGKTHMETTKTNTPKEYGEKAINFLKGAFTKGGSEIYYQVHKGTIAVYNRAENLFLTYSAKGIETFFGPADGTAYVDEGVEAGKMILLKK